MNWTTKQGAYGEKSIKHITRHDDGITEYELYYREHAEKVRNQYGVEQNEYDGTYDIVLHTTTMRKDGDFYSGGIGNFTVISTGHKRKMVAQLYKVADELGELTHRTTAEPTLIVGRA